jgi:hypothetical protein
MDADEELTMEEAQALSSKSQCATLAASTFELKIFDGTAGHALALKKMFGVAVLIIKILDGVTLATSTFKLKVLNGAADHALALEKLLGKEGVG